MMVSNSFSGYANYRVSRGDSMWQIAKEHGLTVEELQKANPEVTNANVIHSGQSLRIPKRRSPTEAPMTAVNGLSDQTLRVALEGRMRPPVFADIPPAAAPGMPTSTSAQTWGDLALDDEGRWHTGPLGETAQMPPTARGPVTSLPEPATPGTANRTLADWFGQPSNYAEVARQFSTRKNMCANFTTMALEKSGALVIPRGEKYPGFDDDGSPKSVRSWAPSLARYLEEKKGWNRVGTSELAKGDLLFTKGPEGTYNHVMTFMGWLDESKKVAQVIDNQGHTHRRSLTGADGKSPVMYGLRAP